LSEHLYIHVPFCLKKCRYCDFYSEIDLSLVSEYVASLILEIQLRSEMEGRGQAPCVKTVYFGGGTPSILPLDAIGAILDCLHHTYQLASDAEITLETNPGTLESDYLNGLNRLGINRLSIGIQSFDDQKLALLGRIHTGKQAEQAIEAAQGAGFDNIGLDLIYGLPGETGSDWTREMDAALAFAPDHLSCYMLTLEPGTPLYHRYEKGLFTPMGSHSQVDLFSLTSTYLTRLGYDHYEISNFARAKERRSRHNSAYWKMVSYTGFGPSAHSYWVRKDRGNPEHIRSWNHSDLKAYIRSLYEKCLPVEESETLTVSQQMLEWIMVGLRTRSGLDINAFDALSSSSFQEDYRELILGLEDEQLGRITNGNALVLSRSGWACLDNIIEGFARSFL